MAGRLAFRGARQNEAERTWKQHTQHSVTAPKYVTIPIEINDNHGTFLIDMSSNRTIIDSAYAQPHRAEALGDQFNRTGLVENDGSLGR